MATIIQFALHKKKKRPCGKCGSEQYGNLWLCFSCDAIMGCSECRPKGGRGLCADCREDIGGKLIKTWQQGD